VNTDPFMIANEALKIAVLSAIDDEDASDEVVGEFIDTAFDDYNTHVGKLLLDPRVDGEQEHGGSVAKLFNELLPTVTAKSFAETLAEEDQAKLRHGVNLKSGAEGGPSTGAEAEDKARRRRKDQAEAQRRAAEQRATTKQQRWETQMDITEVAERVAKGMPTKFTKAEFFAELDRRAQAEKKPGESVAQAFARFAETDIGKVLMQAHKLAGGPDHQFEKPLVTKADAAPTPSLDKLKDLASAHQADNPGKTYEASFATVYGDPANRDLVNSSKTEARDKDSEQSSIDAARRWGVEGQFRPAGSIGRTEQRAS